MFTACGRHWLDVVPAPEVLHPECVCVCVCPWSGCCMMLRANSEVTGYNGVGWPDQQIHSSRLFCALAFVLPPLPQSRTARQRTFCSRCDGLNRMNAENLSHDPPVSAPPPFYLLLGIPVQLWQTGATPWHPQHHGVFALWPGTVVAREAGGARLLGLRSLGSTAWWGDLQALRHGHHQFSIFVKIRNKRNNCCMTKWETFCVKIMALLVIIKTHIAL